MKRYRKLLYTVLALLLVWPTVALADSWTLGQLQTKVVNAGCPENTLWESGNTINGFDQDGNIVPLSPCATAVVATAVAATPTPTSVPVATATPFPSKGLVTMTGGQATVSYPPITSSCTVLVAVQSGATSLSVVTYTITAGVGFKIAAVSALMAGTISWEVLC